MIMKDMQGRVVEAEIDYNQDGMAFFTGVGYPEDDVELTDEEEQEVLDYLEENYQGVLDTAASEAYEQAMYDQDMSADDQYDTLAERDGLN